MIFFFGKEAVLIMVDECMRHSYTRPLAYKGMNKDDHPENDHHDQDDHHHHDTDAAHRHSIDGQHHEVTHSDMDGLHEEEKVASNGKAEKTANGKHDHHEDYHNSDNHSSASKNTNNTGSRVTPEKIGEVAGPNAVLFVPNPKEYLNMKNVWYYIITLACYFIVVILSIVVEDVQLVFGIVGSTASTFAVLWGPGSFYIISFHKKKMTFVDYKTVALYTLAWVYTIMGLICCIVFGT